MVEAKIGVQAMMLKEKFEELGPYQTLKKIVELGYHAVEISQIPMTPENVQEIKQAKEDFDLDIASLSCVVSNDGAGGGNDDLETQFDKIVADCKTLGVDLLRIGMLPFPNMRNLETVLDFTRQANKYAKDLKEHGIDLYYHNHHVEFRKYDGKFLLDIIAEECPELGFEVDLHWVQRGGANPIDVLDKHAGRTALVHLKDYRIGEIPEEAFQALEEEDVMTFYQAFTNIIEFAELGQGSMDYKPIIEKALDTGVRYLLVEQDMLYGRDPFDCLADSRDHLIALGYEDLF
ncbi:sugar phosphate isomerase/epimerase family protein [Aerococcus kribbianus]|uniref:Sugar phosphate isomerase/epimerase n=1 Tax=Aerococcus kribbianus TaxID=2999064 RepID=A0A9X3JF83_9LACT|nr:MULTISPECIES: sugar phosphate isomerase/epimerase [unclassified Aerococcus]MCZ0717348.1 sugar phosphate isomerase/epimerase [Aerococcus sp. YH-aer221]MCZ0725636.1 sugar phosphate isomerase/epimerase [Aerococcus sp. YH-aer222]